MAQTSRIDCSRLTAAERREIEDDVRAHGLSGAARLHGIGRAALSSLLAGAHREGTLALFRERRRARETSTAAR